MIMFFTPCSCCPSRRPQRIRCVEGLCCMCGARFVLLQFRLEYVLVDMGRLGWNLVPLGNIFIFFKSLRLSLSTQRRRSRERNDGVTRNSKSYGCRDSAAPCRFQWLRTKPIGVAANMLQHCKPGLGGHPVPQASGS